MHFYKLLFISFLSLTVYAKGDHQAQNGTAAAGQEHKGNGTHHGHDKHEGHNGTAKDTAKFQCAEISRLTALTDLVNNSTKFASFTSHHNLTAAQQTKLKDEAANATTKLNTLKSNSTLVSECATIDASSKLQAQCKEMSRLTKITDLANNATALADLQSKHNLTAAQVDKIKDEAANATTKLNAMKSNSTLVSACNDLKAENNGAGTATASATAGAKATNSGAGGRIAMLANGVFAAFSVGLAILLAL